MSKELKSKQVSATIPAEYHEALENYRWNPAVKLTMTELVRKALDEYTVTHKINVSGDSEAPAPSKA